MKACPSYCCYPPYLRATIYCAFIMQAKSEYFESLLGKVRVRYEAKVLTAGLTKDPYSITEWVEEPTVTPDIKWSNFMLYMVSTPSPYHVPKKR